MALLIRQHATAIVPVCTLLDWPSSGSLSPIDVWCHTPRSPIDFPLVMGGHVSYEHHAAPVESPHLPLAASARSLRQ